MAGNILTVVIPLESTQFYGPVDPDMSFAARAQALGAKLSAMSAFFQSVSVTFPGPDQGPITVTCLTNQDATKAQAMVNLILITIQQYWAIAGMPTFNFVPQQVQQTINQNAAAAQRDVTKKYQATSPIYKLSQGDVVGAVGLGVKETANLITGQAFDAGVAGGENPDDQAAFDWTTVAIYAAIGLGVFLLIKFID